MSKLKKRSSKAGIDCMNTKNAAITKIEGANPNCVWDSKSKGTFIGDTHKL